MTTEAEARYQALEAETRERFPGFRIIQKRESRFHRAIDVALRIVTFGQMREYLEGYHTTMGQRMYVTSDWPKKSADRRYQILRHERVHMEQFRRYTWPGMAIAYLLLPLPMGLAYCRARLEWTAYAESIRAGAECHGVDHVASGSFRAHIIEQFCGPSYGWMWPFRRRVEGWYDAVLDELRGG